MFSIDTENVVTVSVGSSIEIYIIYNIIYSRGIRILRHKNEAVTQ
jgi:hypothetical protein